MRAPHRCALLGLTTLIVGVIVSLPSQAPGSSEGDGDRKSDPMPVRRVAYQADRAGRGLSVRWIGQDGHDLVGTSNAPGPNDIQDIHLALVGLDPRRDIALVAVSMPNGSVWEYSPEHRHWWAEIRRRKDASQADVFLEPAPPDLSGPWHVIVRYGDGSQDQADFRGRRVDPRLRVAAAGVKARWIGQDGSDVAGLGPNVGPDGFQDVRIHLDGLGIHVPIKAIRVEAGAGERWEFGVNPQRLNSAELVKKNREARTGDLHIQPDRNLAGARIRLMFLYEDGSTDSASVEGRRCDPNLRVAQVPLPRVEPRPIKARWLGQDGSLPARPGDVHVVVSGVASSGPPAAVELTDTVRGEWRYRDREEAPARGDGEPGSLFVRPSPDRKSLDLYFTPYRDTSNETFSLRLVLADGRSWSGRFSGGACDLTKRSPLPEASKTEARPGDDLQSLVDRFGTVILSAGTYRLSHPLVLNRPVRLSAAAGATLLFEQAPGDAPWSRAIKVRCGNTTLEGFAVRFAGPIRWNEAVTRGPAVIGMTDSLEPGFNDPKIQVVFRNLDIDVPSIAPSGAWVEALSLFRLAGAHSGAIIGNRLRGGSIEFFHGPWLITDNDYRGTPPGTFSHGLLVGHETHDLVIRGNRMSSPAPSGKTWRFLVLTGYGRFARIEQNVIEGTGDRDGDTIPWANAPEIILTESYSLRYEGKVLAASGDGKLLRIGQIPGSSSVEAGDVVAILNGPAAGNWRRVAHVIDPTTLLLDEPLPSESDRISICAGFVGQVYEGNRIDLRGGRRSDSFVLPGNHFGTRVVGNHLLGGGLGWRMIAYATESPGMWGWSHTPFLGGVVERNILEDCEQGGIVGVEHSPSTKTNRGRTYMSLRLRDNVVRWTQPFLGAWERAGHKEPPPGLVIGYQPSADPEELIVSAAGNRLEAGTHYPELTAVKVHTARFNGQKLVEGRPEDRAGGTRRREARTGGTRPLR